MRSFKNIEFANLLFYFSSLIAIIIAAFFERKFLIYILPVVIISLGIIYIIKATKISFLYLIALFLMIICDILIYSDFETYFPIICFLTSIYFFISTLVLIKFIKPKKFTAISMLSIPIIISSLLILYLIFSITQLVYDSIKDMIPLVVLNVSSLLAYVIVSYFVYIMDVYREGLNILIVACLCIFITSLIPINELFYYSTVFTVFINITHILGFYLFVNFLIDTNPKKIESESKNYL